MVNGIRRTHPCGLNKGFSLKFCEDSQIQQGTPDIGWRVHCLKQ